MGKLARSWSIFRKSLTLMNQERKLLIFPLLSFVAVLALAVLVLAGIAGAVLLGGEADAAVDAAAETTGYVEAWSGVIVFALLYLVSMLLANFFNVAFFSEILRGLGGEPVSVRRGFVFASRRLKAIFFWSLLASTVGVILSVLEQRAGLIGMLVLKLIGVVWAVASVFAVPAIVCDPELNNPFTALKCSALAIRRTWGESLIGFVGLRVITGMGAALLVLGMIPLAALCIMTDGAVAAVIFSATMLLVMILALCVLGYLVGVAQQIYIASLYLYANDRPVGAFSEEELASAFRSKK